MVAPDACHGFSVRVLHCEMPGPSVAPEGGGGRGVNLGWTTEAGVEAGTGGFRKCALPLMEVRSEGWSEEYAVGRICGRAQWWAEIWHQLAREASRPFNIMALHTANLLKP